MVVLEHKPSHECLSSLTVDFKIEPTNDFRKKRPPDLIIASCHWLDFFRKLAAGPFQTMAVFHRPTDSERRTNAAARVELSANGFATLCPRLLWNVRSNVSQSPPAASEGVRFDAKLL